MPRYTPARDLSGQITFLDSETLKAYPLSTEPPRADDPDQRPFVKEVVIVPDSQLGGNLHVSLVCRDPLSRWFLYGTLFNARKFDPKGHYFQVEPEQAAALCFRAGRELPPELVEAVSQPVGVHSGPGAAPLRGSEPAVPTLPAIPDESKPPKPTDPRPLPEENQPPKSAEMTPPPGDQGTAAALASRTSLRDEPSAGK